jgi:aerobic-type carbon monoxide dehydrogenase small subunit (CoxS/CutS family)
MQTRHVEIEINGTAYAAEVDVRMLLSDFIRHEARLTGTNVGCEHGVCGACTIQLDGDPVRSCLLLAVQAHGRRIRTVESLSADLGEDEMHPLQQAFHEAHGLQCGFCTPGFLMSVEPLLVDERELTDQELRETLAGNICRCTGYQNIVTAVRDAQRRVRDGSP